LRLLSISAEPHPFGNRIFLEWENPEPELYPLVRIVRKEGTYPTDPEDGHTVVEKDSFLFSITDLTVIADLDNGIIPSSIFQLFLAEQQIVITNSADVNVLNLGLRWLFSEENNQFILVRVNGSINVYRKGKDTVPDTNLKSETIYYYSLFPYGGDPPEYSFDRENRTAAMATGKYNMAGQMYSLLPGIYHRYDTVLSGLVADEDKDKGELRRFLDIPGSIFDQFHSFAKSILNTYDLQKIDGCLLPQLAQWIGWKTDFSREIQTQRNEIGFAPDLYRRIGIIPTVEATVKRMSGWESRTKEFVHNVFLSNRPERLNIWTQMRNNSGEWTTDTDPLSLDFAYEGRPAIVRDTNDRLWLFYHTYRKRQWKRGRPPREICNIWYKTFDGVNGCSSSQPLTNRLSIDKYPATVMQGDRIWVFWSVYDEQNNIWHIEYKTMTDDEWSPVFNDNDPFGGTDAERKKPLAVRDGSGGIWLFWLERKGTSWQMKYNRHDGTSWQLPLPADFPMNSNTMEDAFCLSNFDDPAAPVYIFWAQKEPSGQPDIKHWVIAYRFKQSSDPAISDWSAVQILPKIPADAVYHDREPAACINNDGEIELFWASNRDGSWSVWADTLDDIEANDAANAWQITNGPYSQRDPLPYQGDENLTLIYRSNRSVSYTSDVYKATTTTDFRYSGCTTVDTRNSDKLSLQEKFDDFQTYTYDVSKNNEDWYARDTIGLYLNNDTMDKEKIEIGIDRIEKVLNEFMPITDRAVFVTQQDVHIDRVYSYSSPLDDEARFINRFHNDILTSVSSEEVTGPGEDIS
jgi:hypothetical protein